MKHLALAFIYFLVSCIPFAALAQDTRNNHETGVFAGAYFPLYGDNESDAMFGLYYGETFHNGLGYKVGFRYMPSVADISHNFGIPVAITYKTNHRSHAQRLGSAFDAAYDTVEASYDDGSSVEASYLFANFLVNLFRNWEFSIGMTPSYVAGNSSSGAWTSDGIHRWTEKETSPALTLDAGVALCFNIWRFDLKFTPAVHYSLTRNYICHVEMPSGHSTKTLRWFVSVGGALSFNF